MPKIISTANFDSTFFKTAASLTREAYEAGNFDEAWAHWLGVASEIIVKMRDQTRMKNESKSG